jgi:hypothetical protein
LRPITLEDEDFIKNIKVKASPIMKSGRGTGKQVFEINPKTLTNANQDEEGDWDDILTPS